MSSTRIQLYFDERWHELDNVKIFIDEKELTSRKPFQIEGHCQDVDIVKKESALSKNQRRFILGILLCKLNQGDRILLCDNQDLDWKAFHRALRDQVDPKKPNSIKEHSKWIDKCTANMAYQFYEDPLCQADDAIVFKSGSPGRIKIFIGGEVANQEDLRALSQRYADTLRDSLEHRIRRLFDGDEHINSMHELAIGVIGWEIHLIPSLLLAKCELHRSWNLLLDLVKERGPRLQLESLIYDLDLDDETIMGPEDVASYRVNFEQFRNRFLEDQSRIKPLFGELLQDVPELEKFYPLMRTISNRLTKWEIATFRAEERETAIKILRMIADFKPDEVENLSNLVADSGFPKNILERKDYMKVKQDVKVIQDQILKDLNQLHGMLVKTATPVIERSEQCRNVLKHLLECLEQRIAR